MRTPYEYLGEIENLLDNALNDLSSDDFQKLLDMVTEHIEEYD